MVGAVPFAPVAQVLEIGALVPLDPARVEQHVSEGAQLRPVRIDSASTGTAGRS